ncbi:MAG TPA: DMT family transporter [Planctomycetota bacterium]|jgi:drug/metabolite transporter (DMT)-like permease|nr:DMT family transporter [Planctomycetota bacterium]|tara:strand:- start:302 stop:1177 length:876 start_codon:yes stop_codon:yes gene_type:complete
MQRVWASLWIGLLGVSTGAVLVKLAGSEAHHLTIASWRCLVAAAILFLIAPFQIVRSWKSFERRTVAKLMIGGALLAVHFGSWIASLQYTSVVSSLALVTTTPLWAAIFSHFLLRESATKRQIQGILIAALGLGFFVLSQSSATVGSRPLLGNALALLGAISFSLYLITSRSLQKTLPVIPFLSSVYGVAGVLLLSVVLLTQESFLGFSSMTYLWLLLCGILPQLIGHSGYNFALRRLSPPTVSIALIGEPVLGSIFAWAVLGEGATSGEIFGGCIILYGIFYASRKPHFQ